MTSEDLFRAIGTVESSRLLRSELTVSENASCDAQKEEPNMKRHTLTRGLRNLLVAAALISALAVTAYAAMKTFGLKDLLSQWGMQDTSALENLTVTPVETDSAPSEGETFAHATRYAGFTVEEAILEMNLVGHSFFLFRNVDTDEINVVYRRKNGSYGLLVAKE